MPRGWDDRGGAMGARGDPHCRARTPQTKLCPMARLWPLAMAMPHAQAVAHRQNVSHGHGNAPQPMAKPHSKPVHKQWRDHVWPQILVPGEPMPGPGIRGTGETRRTRGPGSAEAAGARARAGNPAAAAAGSSKAAVSFCCTAWGWGAALGASGAHPMASGPWPHGLWSSSHGTAPFPAPGPSPTTLQACDSRSFGSCPKVPAASHPTSPGPLPCSLRLPELRAPQLRGSTAPSRPPSWVHSHLCSTTVGPGDRV